MTGKPALVPCGSSDYPLLLQWVTSEQDMLLWAGPIFRWPLTLGQISSHLADPEVTALLLILDGEKIGFIELVREPDNAYRLCRVLIGPRSLRGKGLGRDLLQQAIDYARERLLASRLALHVFENNAVALQCYRSLGFEVVSRDERGHQVADDWWCVLRMEREFDRKSPDDG